MSLQIEDIIKEIKAETGMSATDIERIVDTQFKCIEDHIRSKTTKVLNIIYLGKFRPTSWFLKNQDKFTRTNEEHEAYKKAQRNIKRMEKLSGEQSGSKASV